MNPVIKSREINKGVLKAESDTQSPHSLGQSCCSCSGVKLLFEVTLVFFFPEIFAA